MALSDFIMSEQQGEDIKTALDTIVTNTSSLGGRAEDTAHMSGDSGAGVLAVRQDVITTSVNADGDYGFLKIDADGALYVNVAGGSTSATEFNEDAAHTTADAGIQMLAVRQDALSSSVDSDGDYASLKLTAAGRLWSSATIDTELPAGTQNIGDVDVASLPGTVAADITATKTATETIAAAVSTEMQVDIVGITPDLMLGTDFSDVLGTSDLTSAVDPTLVADGAEALRVHAFNSMFNGATWDALQGSTADGLLVNLGANNDITVTSGSITETNSAAILSDTTNILADTANMDTNLGTVAAAVAGGQMQVDLVATTPDLMLGTDFSDVLGTSDLTSAVDPTLAADGQEAVRTHAFNAMYNGATWDAVQGSTADGLLVNLGANNDVTVTSGTITETNSADIEALLTTIDADTGNMDTSLNNIETSTGNIDGHFAADDAVLGSGVLVQGDDGTNRKNINVDATTGDVQVDVTHTVTVDATTSGDVPITLAGEAVVLGASDGTDIGDVDVASQVPGTGATNLGKAVDAVAGGSDTGVALLAEVEATTSAITPVDGDYARLKVNANGALHVNVDSVSAASANYAEDAPHTHTDTGNFVLSVRQDTAAALAGTAGDYAPFITDASGQLYVVEANSGDILADTANMDTNLGTIATNTGTMDTSLNNIEAAFAADATAYGSGVLMQGDDGTDRRAVLVDTDGHVQVDILSGSTGSTQYAEDAPHVSGNTGTMALAVRADTAATTGSLDGDYVPLLTDANGRLHVLDANSAEINTSLNNIETDIDTIASAVDTELQVDIVGITPDLMLGTDFSTVMGTATLTNLLTLDTVTTSTDSLWTSGFNYVFNGVTWDRLRGSAADGVTVNLGTNNDVTVTSGAITETNSADILADTANMDTNLATLAGTVSGSEVQVDIVSGSASSTQYDEDTVHNTGDTGTMMLGVRNDTPSALAGTDGDYIPLTTDNEGKLYIQDPENKVDAGNSTTTPLGGGAAFTGTGVDMLQYQTVVCTIFADQASATDGMTFQFSTDNSNWDDVYSFTMAASETRRFQFPITAQYFRVVYTNGATPQTVFRLQTICITSNTLTSIHRIEDTVSLDKSAQLMKSAIIAQSEGANQFEVITANQFGAINVEPEQHTTLDEMNATTGWGAINSDTTGLATSTNHIVGSNSLEFDKVDGAANTDIGGIEKTISSVDLGDISPHDIIQTPAYIPDLTDVTQAFVRLGTDSSNYNEWHISSSNLTAATWQTLVFNVGSSDFASSTGNGWDHEAVTYIAVGCLFNSPSDSLANIQFDQLSFHTNMHSSTSINSEVTSSVNSSNVNVEQIFGENPTMEAGNVASGTQRVTIATNDANLASINTDMGTLAGAVTGTEMQVDVITMPTVTETNSAAILTNTADIETLLTGIDVDTDAINTATAAIAVDTGNIDTSLNNIEAGFAADDAALGSGVLIQGDDGTNRKNINVDATTGDVQVDVTNTVTVDATSSGDVPITLGGEAVVLGASDGTDIGDVDVASLPSEMYSADFDSGGGTVNAYATGIIVKASGGPDIITGDIANGLDVDVTRVSGTVTTALGSAIPAGDNNIGNVDIVTLPGTVESDIADIKTAVEVIDNLVSTEHGAIGSGVLVFGDDGLNLAPLRAAGTGELYITSDGNSDDIASIVDNAAGGFDKGIAPLAVRDDALTTLTPVDGDYTYMRVNSTGALWTEEVNSAEINTSLNNIEAAVDGSEMQVDIVGSLPAGTNAIGKLAANDGVDIGDVDVTDIVPGTGATNLGKAVDAVAGASDTGIALLAVRDDATGTLTPVDGDYVQLRTNANGALHVNIDSVTTQASSNYAEDTVHTTADLGNMVLSVRTDTAAALGGTDGDYQPFITDANGRLHVLDGNSAEMNTSLNNIEAGFATEGSALGSGVLLQGDDGTDRKNINVDATTGDVQVDVTNTVTVSGTITETNSAAILADTASMDTNLATIAGDTTSLDGKDLMLGTDFSNVLGTASLVTATQADNLVNTTDAVNTAALGYVFDGTAWDRLRGDSTNGVTVNLGANNDVVEASAASILSDTTAILADTASMDTNLATIAGDTTSLDGKDLMLGTDFSNVLGTASLVTATQADNLASTLDGVNTTTFNYVYDGATWDMLRGDATNGALVNLGTNNDVITTGPDAENAAITGNPILIGGEYNTAHADLHSGDIGAISLTKEGYVNVQITDASIATTVSSLPSSTNTLEVVGDVADNAVAAGNPVLVGGVVNTDGSERTLAGSDATYMAANTYGSLIADIRRDGRSSATNETTGTGLTAIATTPGASKKLVLEYLHVQNASAVATEMNILSASTEKLKFRLAAEDGFGVSIPVDGLEMNANEAMNIQATTSTTYYWFAKYRTVRA